MIRPTASFKDNLSLLPAITGIARIDLTDGAGLLKASIENQPGKQGSLAVYAWLQNAFGALSPEAAAHGLEVFAEHTADAKARPGAHPNIDRLLEIIATGETLRIEVVKG
ncbi:DUF2322 family protein [Falsigemmobacter faecalis]|uniref:DUF2322 family protein n=1 Tax=Falsigemmobacter faecalis TaxID=2488730 RepID=A0A3P3DGW6_9RHOB|nr:DUF2322 family protein [Falsigemmobacter faecalis]RRH73505.1 DUF2322 family protein [Falsigemmobacter faecalis]